MRVVFPTEAARRGLLGAGTPLPDLSSRGIDDLVRQLRAEQRKLIAPDRPGRKNPGGELSTRRLRADLVDLLAFGLSADGRRQQDPRPIVEILESTFPARDSGGPLREARLRELPRFLGNARRRLVWPDPRLCHEVTGRLATVEARLAAGSGGNDAGRKELAAFRQSIEAAASASAGVRLDPTEWLARLSARSGRSFSAPEIEALVDVASAAASASFGSLVETRFLSMATQLETASLASLDERTRREAQLRRIVRREEKEPSSDLAAPAIAFLESLSIPSSGGEAEEKAAPLDPLTSLLVASHGPEATRLGELACRRPGTALLASFRRRLPPESEAYRPFFGSPLDEAWTGFAVDLVCERGPLARIDPDLELARRHLRLLEALAAQIDVRLGLSTAPGPVVERWASDRLRREGFLDEGGASTLLEFLRAEPGRETLRLLSRRELDRALSRSEKEGEALGSFLRRFLEAPPVRPAELSTVLEMASDRE
jgi:hypothetical protein